MTDKKTIAEDMTANGEGWALSESDLDDIQADVERLKRAVQYHALRADTHWVNSEALRKQLGEERAGVARLTALSAERDSLKVELKESHALLERYRAKVSDQLKPCPLCGGDVFSWMDHEAVRRSRCKSEACCLGAYGTALSCFAWEALPRFSEDAEEVAEDIWCTAAGYEDNEQISMWPRVIRDWAARVRALKS